MEGISIQPENENPSKLSIYHYKYLFEHLMVSKECDEEFWIPLVKDFQYALKSWDHFHKTSFQVTSAVEIRGDFSKAFKKEIDAYLVGEEDKELLPRLMIKYSNVYERRLTLPRILNFYNQERVYFIRCFHALFLNCIKHESEIEKFPEDMEDEGERDIERIYEEIEGEGEESPKKIEKNKSMNWTRIVEILCKGKVDSSIRKLFISSLSRKYYEIEGNGNNEKDRSESQYDQYYSYMKLYLTELSEELDLLFMMIFSRKYLVSLDKQFPQFLFILVDGRTEEDKEADPKGKHCLKFGNYFYVRKREHMIQQECCRIPALCVLNFLQLLQHLDESDALDFPDDLAEKNPKKFKAVQSYFTRFQHAINQAKSNTAFYGLVCFAWSAFLKQNWNRTLDLIYGGRKLIESMDKIGIELSGLSYICTLFGRDDRSNYPFYGYEQNIQIYKSIVLDFLTQFLLTIEDLERMDHVVIKEVGVAINALIEPYENVRMFENKFVKDFYWNYIDLSEIPVDIHPFTKIFFIVKSFIPSQLEFLSFFANLIFDPGSAWTIASYVNRLEILSLDFSNDELKNFLSYKKVKPTIYGQSIIPLHFDEESKSSKIFKELMKNPRFEEYMLIEDYHDHWMNIIIPKGTRFIRLYEFGKGRGVFGFHNVKEKLVSSRGEIRFRKLSGIRIFLSFLMNLKSRLLQNFDISFQYIRIFMFFEKIIRHGSHALLRYIDHQLFQLHTKNFFSKNNLPNIGSGLLFLRLLGDLLTLVLDNLELRIGEIQDASYLTYIIQGIWKCLNSFSFKKPREVMTIVMKHLSSFPEIVEVEGFRGIYNCVLELLEIFESLTIKHSLKYKEDVFFLMEWMSSNIFVGHLSWKYNGFTDRWKISLKCLELFNKLIEYYSVDELECFLESLFFDQNNNCGFTLIGLLGQCKIWYKEVLEKQRGDDIFLLIAILEEGFKLLKKLLKLRNYYNFSGIAIHNSLNQLIGKDQIPFIRILFQYTLVQYPNSIRKKALDVIRHILNDPRISILSSLGSRVSKYIGKQLHFLQDDMEEDLLKIKLIKLIHCAIRNEKGVGELYITFDPEQYHFSEVEKSKGAFNNSKHHTYVKKNELQEDEYLSILFSILKNNCEKISAFENSENCEKLISVCLESLETIFSQCSRDHVRLLIENNFDFWKILFKLLFLKGVNYPQEIFRNININNTTTKKNRNRKSDISVINSVKSIFNIMSIDLYYGKLINTFGETEKIPFKSFFLEYKQNPLIFHEVLRKIIYLIKLELDNCCDNLIILKKKVEEYNLKYSRRKLNLEDFRCLNNPKEVYDLNRLKRWKFRVLLRKELEEKENIDPDRFLEIEEKQIDLFIKTTHPDYEMIANDEKEILNLVNSLNLKYLLMKYYFESLSSFISCFTIFIIPLKDKNNIPIFISFPQISSFLDIFLFKGLEHYSKKLNLPNEIKNMQSVFHNKCAEGNLYVLKGISQIISIDNKDRKNEELRKNSKNISEKYKFRKYFFENHFKVLCFCLEREIKFNNFENIIIILTNFIYLFSKIPSHAIDIHIDFSSITLVPLLILILEKISFFEYNKNSFILTNKQNKKASKISKLRVHQQNHNFDKKIENIFNFFDNNNNVDEDEDEEKDELKNQKNIIEELKYKCVNLSLSLLSTQKIINLGNIKIIISLLENEGKLSFKNEYYRPNCEYIENLLVLVSSIITESKNRDTLRNEKKSRKQKQSENDRKINTNNPKSFVFEDKQPLNFVKLPAYPIIVSSILDFLPYIIFRIFPFWNNLIFKTSIFLNQYKKIIRRQSPKNYLEINNNNNRNLKNEIKKFLILKSIPSKSILFLSKNNISFNSVFSLFQGTIESQKINWSRGYSSRYVSSYPSYHKLWNHCLRIFISLISHFPDPEYDKFVKDKILNSFQLFSDQFIYPLILKQSEFHNNQFLGNEFLFQQKFLNKKKKVIDEHYNDNRKKIFSRNMRNIIDEYNIFTLSELKETKHISELLLLIWERLILEKNEKFLFACIEGFGHSIDLLNRGIESVIKPYTLKERKIYESSFDFQTYFFSSDDPSSSLFSNSLKNNNLAKDDKNKYKKRNREKEDLEIKNNKRNLRKDEGKLISGVLDYSSDSDNSDDDDFSDDDQKGKKSKLLENYNKKNYQSILERTFKLLEKSHQFTWSTRMHFMIFDILRNNLQLFELLLKYELKSNSTKHPIEIFRRHDISSKNFFDHIELVKTCIKLIPKILRISSTEDLLAFKEKNKNKEFTNQEKLSQFENRRKLEKESCLLFRCCIECIQSSLTNCFLHLKNDFQQGINSNNLHHTTPKDLRIKMIGHLRTVLRYVQNVLVKVKMQKQSFLITPIKKHYERILEEFRITVTFFTTEEMDNIKKDKNEKDQSKIVTKEKRVRGGGLFD